MCSVIVFDATDQEENAENVWWCRLLKMTSPPGTHEDFMCHFQPQGNIYEMPDESTVLLSMCEYTDVEATPGM